MANNYNLYTIDSKHLKKELLEWFNTDSIDALPRGPYSGRKKQPLFREVRDEIDSDSDVSEVLAERINSFGQ